MKKKLFGLLLLVASVFVLVACGADSIADKVEVDFSGYDGVGILEYNEKFIDKKIQEELYKKVGFSKQEIEVLLREDEGTLSIIQSSSENIAKYEQYEDYLDSLEYGFDKETELSNGDEVIFEIKSSDDTFPIKSEKKKFKVDGLKKSQKVSIETLLKDQYSFTGFNGFGEVSFKEEFRFSIKEKDKNYLSNGDKVDITVDESYVEKLAQEGKILKDNHSSIEVSGLQEISDIKGIIDILDKVSILAKESNKDTTSTLEYFDKKTYAIEKQQDYIKYTPASQAVTFLVKRYDSLDVVSIYKIVETKTYGKYASQPQGTVETKEYYKIYGYGSIEVLDNQLILSDNLISISSSWDEYDNLDSAVLKLKDKHYMQYVSK